MTGGRAKTKGGVMKSTPRHDEGDDARQSHFGEGRPPFGKSWRMLYALVLWNLAVLVALFYLFTRAFR